MLCSSSCSYDIPDPLFKHHITVIIIIIFIIVVVKLSYIRISLIIIDHKVSGQKATILRPTTLQVIVGLTASLGKECHKSLWREGVKFSTVENKQP
jgi:membrane-anchored glycerophosphoryl diester phosphodiesterase (GDPDase)